MTDPKKRLRQTLYSINPVGYRIKTKSPSPEVMNKKIFKEILEGLKKIEERKDFLQEEIGMDMTAYEDQFFHVIENLFKLAFTKEQLALIQLYIYELVPDKEWDGKITVEIDKKEKIVQFKTPEDVWEVIKIFNK